MVNVQLGKYEATDENVIFSTVYKLSFVGGGGGGSDFREGKLRGPLLIMKHSIAYGHRGIIIGCSLIVHKTSTINTKKEYAHKIHITLLMGTVRVYSKIFIMTSVFFHHASKVMHT